jgi:hypothetical protein
MSRGRNKRGEKGKREKGEKGKKPVNPIIFDLTNYLFPPRQEKTP